MEHMPDFYGKKICREDEEAFIKEILGKYKDLPINEETKKKVYDELCWEKHLGRLTIPFSVQIKKDPYERYPDFIEVLLESKV
jgi:hypothetical protein